MSYAEWEYIIFNRENHEKLFGLASIDGLSYGDVKGLIILPDDWALPDGLSFNASTDAGNVTLIYTTSSNGPAYNYSDPNFSYSYPPEMYNTTTYMYNQNHYTVSEWAQMEAAGAVFLPAAGQRQYYSSYASFFMVNIGVEACYWTSDRHEVADALYLGSSSDAGIGKCSEMKSYSP